MSAIQAQGRLADAVTAQIGVEVLKNCVPSGDKISDLG